MSSDYIPRLRRELLRAGSTKRARWGWVPRAARGLRPVVAAAAVAALVAVAVVLALPDVRSDERGAQPAADAVRISYRVEPPSIATAEQTADVMRARLATAGIDADVSVSQDAGLTISAPAGSRADVAALTQRGQVAIYDWERTVLGPTGKATPTDAGGTPGVAREQAEARAAAVPGGRVVRADFGGDPRWYALGGAPALTDADIERAEPAVDAATEQPAVAIEFTASGQTAFSTLTRELAHRGSASAGGADDVESAHHFAIVIDNRLVALPYISFWENPDGIDGADGTQISGDLEPETARLTAAILSTGPLPATLSSPGSQAVAQP